jgi:hypothetical protein
MMATEELLKARERLRKAYIKAGYDLKANVDFWGMKISLDEAINKMDKGDIKDGYKQIRWNAYVDAHPELSGKKK